MVVRTSKIPTAVQTARLTATRARMILITGNGSFRMIGSRLWYSVALIEIMRLNAVVCSERGEDMIKDALRASGKQSPRIKESELPKTALELMLLP
jgi:hypothetical protein